MRVLALGDSWAQLGVNHLVAELGDGWDVRLRAKTGDTACHWAKKWTVARPRLDAYSPRSYFLGDCTHPNADGFRVLFKELLRRRAFQI